jgi:hypothetical protein
LPRTSKKKSSMQPLFIHPALPHVNQRARARGVRGVGCTKKKFDADRRNPCRRSNESCRSAPSAPRMRQWYSPPPPHFLSLGCFSLSVLLLSLPPSLPPHTHTNTYITHYMQYQKCSTKRVFLSEVLPTVICNVSPPYRVLCYNTVCGITLPSIY